MPTKFPRLGRSRHGTIPLSKLTPRTGPTINRGKGNNNAGTPWKFIRAVESKFGPIYADLACTTANMKADRGLALDEGTDSLTVDWAKYLAGGLGWCNPPFTNITPWAMHHAANVGRGARTLLLVPASAGANWYWDWVAPFADVYSVGRMVFDDCYDKHGELITTSYPKDLILAHYELGVTGRSYADHHADPRAELIRWRWQDDVPG